jgi:Ni/Co efflux regulator RcnB
MNKLRSFLVTGTAIVMALGSAAVAQAQYYHQPVPPGYYHHHHHWHAGDRYYGPRHFVHWRRYRLPPPPYGYVWVQAGPQFLLIGPGGVISRVW